MTTATHRAKPSIVSGYGNRVVELDQSTLQRLISELRSERNNLTPVSVLDE